MSNSATISPPQGNDSDLGPCCQNCGAPQAAREPVCRRCGYYAVLGRVLDLEEIDAEENQQQKTKPTMWEVWSTLIPAWGWGLILCALAVVAESVAGSVMLRAGSPARTLWSLSQLGVCALALALVHVFAYVSHMMLDASAGMLDFILKPIVCWKPAFSKLPKTFCRVSILVSAVTGILMSLLVLRSLNYEALLDWGIEPAPKQNLLAAVIDQAKKVKSKEEDLEAALSNLDDPTEDEELEKEPPRIDVDCVIVGYLTTKEDPAHFTALLLAGEVQGKLRIVATVSSGIPDDVRHLLDERMPKMQRNAPFVDSDMKANWVEPRMVCRVKCLKQLQNGQLEDPIFEKLLTELSIGR
jgi:hypothetical protein